MINPVTIVQDVNLAISAVEKIKVAIPKILGLVDEIKKTYADKGSPAAFELDLANLLVDIKNDLSLIAGLFPSSTTTVTVAPVTPQ